MEPGSCKCPHTHKSSAVITDSIVFPGSGLNPLLKSAVQDADASVLAVGGKNAPTDPARPPWLHPGRLLPGEGRGGLPCSASGTHGWADLDVVTMVEAIVPGLEGLASGTPRLIDEMVMSETF
ncbi:hypothetical protein F5883DRAFT_564569 [Diaporthe sp. PMI_573]|nr:hypothetical protein F5883DRAFT_564569 [Diaporthaceae sp. PMI_573]